MYNQTNGNQGEIMKKAFVCLSAIFVLTTGLCFGQQNYSQMTETHYSVRSKFGVYYRTPVSKIIHNYNEAGLETELCIFNEKDEQIQTIGYEYDMGGTLVAETNRSVIALLNQRTEYEYDEYGQQTSASTWDIKGQEKILNEKIIIKRSGNKVIKTGYDTEGALIWRTVDRYSESNELLQEEQYESDGIKGILIFNTWAADGSLLQRDVYDETQRPVESTLFIYNDENQLEEIQVFDGDGRICNRYVYKYDAKGNVSSIYTYDVADKFGQVYNELSSIQTFTYKY